MGKINVAIVAAEFNYDVTYAMVELAKEHIKFLDANLYKVVKVPGVFDMPLAIKKVLQDEKVDCVVALGAVIEGQTEHDEIVAQHAARKIADLSLEYGKPIGLGIAGPGMSRLEAHERVSYAKRAVEAAIKMVKILREMGSNPKESEESSKDSAKAEYKTRTDYIPLSRDDFEEF
ncbi:MAG: 6,7-dimethyl-8-ribityllumazine synthase [Candidatus Altiarchaeales archaeon]|nr:MAG: 6,7-dimethyl-8-ribityllumazine synthase [Candidatus Altiarchaeales archaeon]